MKARIERWYHMGLWTEEMVMNAVEKGILTAEEAAAILNN